ncbi:MAG TPA: hypothetical protein VFP12_14440 [Allosphingosinicella sp.]|nr:hypothetical protein [Allosphingosinicella sp.]
MMGDGEQGSPGMTTEEQIDEYIAGLPEPKRDEMRDLHQRILRVSPGCRLWFLDGRNEEGKIVSNPNVGYGFQTIKYADGKTREFYRIGLSANTAGISIYVIGIEDKEYLSRTYSGKLGKAKVTGYCIKLKTVKDIDLNILEEIIRFGFEVRNEEGEAG